MTFIDVCYISFQIRYIFVKMPTHIIYCLQAVQVTSIVIVKYDILF